jgi:hypothetical protein
MIFITGMSIHAIPIHITLFNNFFSLISLDKEESILRIRQISGEFTLEEDATDSGVLGVFRVV